ncbi:MAG TPA: amino acid adenylation domain-containing protein [Pyrinomonadaceae bacterium]
MLRGVREVCLGAYTHQELPFERLVEEVGAGSREGGRTPLFQAMFALDNTGTAAWETEQTASEVGDAAVSVSDSWGGDSFEGGLPADDAAGAKGLVLSPFAVQSAEAKFELTLTLSEAGGGWRGSLEYDASLFSEVRVGRLAEHFLLAVEAVCENSEGKVWELELLRGDERRMVLEEWNRTERDYDRTRCVHELIEEQAHLHPDRMALVCEGVELTYGELDARAERLARYLRGRGVGPEATVGVCMPRSAELVVALLAVSKAGGAYLPLDPSYPRERLRYMVEDSGARLVLTAQGAWQAAEGEGEGGVPVVEFEELTGRSEELAESPGRKARPGNVAYVIYTSGSTGRPKGVAVSHAALRHLVAWHTEAAGLGPRDRMTMLASTGFDASVWELWPTLAAGAAILPAPEAVRADASALGRWLEEACATVSFLPTPLAEAALREWGGGRGPSGLRLLLTGGDRLRAWASEGAGYELVNHYGPTEVAVVSTRGVVAVQEGVRGGEFETAAPPIGRPVSNTRVYVLGAGMMPAPWGAPGELYVGGEGLARGYVGRPDLTAERFVPDPFSREPGARLYRTGDVVRYLRDGRLEFLGRADGQVKVRGHRIELGEVEAALLLHARVRECAVAAREGAGGATRLIAYVVSEGGQVLQAEELRSHLRERLPEYMAPSAFVTLEALPLTPNGKVDRKALPEPDASTSGDSYVAPRTPSEEILCAVFSQVLGVERVGVEDNFFDLGGHSLLATQLVSRVRDAFGVELPLRELFEHQTPAGLASAVEALRGAGGTVRVEAVERRSREYVNGVARVPQSFSQQRVFFLEQLQPDSRLFHMPLALRLKGELNVAALEASFEEVVRRHEILRTNFTDKNGEPLQLIRERARGPRLHVEDLRGLDDERRERECARLISEAAAEPFDLERGELIRARLLRTGEREHVLALTLHHIVSDGWSVGVLANELGAHYEARMGRRHAPLAEPPIQYVDFALWQQEKLAGGGFEGDAAYWKNRLAGSSGVLQLPTDRARPAVQTFRGGQVRFHIEAALLEELKEFGRARDVTLHMTLLAALDAMLWKWTGQDDIVVGTLVANRTRKETEALIGMFLNALALRVEVSGGVSFGELLGRVRETAFGAYAHQDLPFEQVVEAFGGERDLSRSPIYQVVFTLQNAPLAPLRIEGLEVETVPIEIDWTPVDLTFSMREEGGRLAGSIEYNADLFDEETVGRMAGHYLNLLRAALADPSRRVAELPMLGEEEERRLLFEWNATQEDYPLELCFHELFERQAARTPDAAAVVCGARRLSYGELNRDANRLAHELVRRGVGTDALVGLYADRGPELLTMMLAVFKAGGAYLPLEPNHPEARTAQIVAQSRAGIVLVTNEHEGRLADVLAGAGTRPSLLNVEALLRAGETEGDLPRRGDPRGLAYVIYTSGSTGVPKGAMVEQSGMFNHLLAKVSDLRLGAGDTVAQTASQCFDISVWQFLAPLVVGGAVRVYADEVTHDPGRLLREAGRDGVTVLEVVPAVLRAMLEGADAPVPESLRWMLVTGEALPPELARHYAAVFPRVPLMNAYGPTECSDDVTHFVLTGAPSDATSAMPIGSPIANTQLYVLDRSLSPVPLGAAGELFVGGAGVGRGYIFDAARTAKVFIPDPFSSQAGARLYRTGDLARHLPDGNLQFLGRVDHQVKIRGFRVELGEIESILRQHSMVQDAVVLAAEDAVGDKRLTGYIVPRRVGMEDSGAAWNAEQVSQWQMVFDGVYTQAANLPEETLNLSGWDSSYTGEPIPEEEMREWVDSTVARILSLKPERVLEIGCGAGLLLLRIAPHCTKYWGTDFAPESLQYVRERLNDLEREIAGVELFQRGADNFEGIAEDSFDAVVINSVAQYFPSIDYLLTVLEGAVKAVAPGGFIYVGDVRNLRMLEAFHLSVQLHKAEPELSREELRQRVLQQIAKEDELVVEPDFFHALKKHLPKIGQVQVHLKRGLHHNELTRFRYDVVLRIGETEGAPADVSWLDWGEQGLTVSSLRQLLEETGPEVLRVARIPNARVRMEARALKWMAGGDGPETAGELREELRGRTDTGIDPEDLRALGRDLRYDVEVSGARSDAGGFYDAVCTRRTGTNVARVPGAEIPQPDASSVRIAPWGEYANNPLQGIVSSDFIPHLRAYLKEKLPEYMVPSVFISLESLPLTPNGKIDRRALPKPDGAQHEAERAYVAPRTSTEEAVAGVWKQVLGLNGFGVRDKFFDVGGDSLKLVRIFRLLGERYPDAPLTVVDLFNHSTIESLSLHLETHVRPGSVELAVQGFEL